MGFGLFLVSHGWSGVGFSIFLSLLGFRERERARNLVIVDFCFLGVQEIEFSRISTDRERFIGGKMEKLKRFWWHSVSNV